MLKAGTRQEPSQGLRSRNCHDGARDQELRNLRNWRQSGRNRKEGDKAEVRSRTGIGEKAGSGTRLGGVQSKEGFVKEPELPMAPVVGSSLWGQQASSCRAPGLLRVCL